MVPCADDVLLSFILGTSLIFQTNNCKPILQLKLKNLKSREFIDFQEDKIKYVELNKNENTTYHTLWDAAKAVFTVRFIALNSHIGKERSQ